MSEAVAVIPCKSPRLRAEKGILHAVRSGQLAPGQRLPSDRELARRLKVAPVTLQNAMRRLCEQGILERQSRVGTFVREANALCHAAIIVFHAHRAKQGGLTQELLSLIQDVALERGRHVRPIVLLDPHPPVAQLCHEMRIMRVGAAGLLSFLNTDGEYIAELAQHVPCVLFNKGLPHPALPTVAQDMFAAARLAMDYLAGERGRKRIAVGHLHAAHQGYLEFAMAIESECSRYGLHVDKSLWHLASSYGEEEEARWLSRLLASGDAPDGIVTFQAAEAVFPLLKERGLTIGRELDVVTLRAAAKACTMPAPWPVIAYDDTATTLAGVRMVFDILDGKLSGAAAPSIRIAPKMVRWDRVSAVG